MQEGNKTTTDERDENKFRMVQFDAPELDIFLVKFLFYSNKDVLTNFFCIFLEKHVSVSYLIFYFLVQENAWLFENEEIQIPLEVPDNESSPVKI